MCYSCNSLSVQQPILIYEEMNLVSKIKIDYSKMETITKLILTSTLQFSVLFGYRLCACHMTGCHYIQALFHSVVLHVQLILSATSGYCACHMTGCQYIQALFHSVVLHVQLILSANSGYCHTQ